MSIHNVLMTSNTLVSVISKKLNTRIKSYQWSTIPFLLLYLYVKEKLCFGQEEITWENDAIILILEPSSNLKLSNELLVELHSTTD